MPVDEILSSLVKEKLVSEAGTVKPNRRVYLFQPEKLREIIKYILDKYGEESLYVSTIVAVDLPQEEKMRLDYYIVFLPEEETVVFRTFIPRENPEIDSLLDLVPGVFNAEAEVYDLMGIVFRGNNALKRGFFVPDDIVEKGVFPLRKDSRV